jgi:hypothetical protein
MLEPQVVIFHEDDIDKIIQECLVYPYCKIMVAVKPSDIKDTALKFLEHIDSKTLARKFKMSVNCAIANFTNEAELRIISNNVQSRGQRASKIYCSPDTTIETYFYIFMPAIFDYKYRLLAFG